jgi:hypothetical protein
VSEREEDRLAVLLGLLVLAYLRSKPGRASPAVVCDDSG